MRWAWGAGLASCRRAVGPARQRGLDQHVRLPHQAQHPLRMDGARLDNTPGGPDAALAPERRLGFEFLHPLEPAFMALDDPRRLVSAHPSPSLST